MRGLFATVPMVNRQASSNEHVIPEGEVQQESNNVKFAVLISWNLDPVFRASQCQRVMSTGSTYTESSGLVLGPTLHPPLCSPFAHPSNSFLPTHALMLRQSS
jgi:hypothetical protein